MRFVLWIVLPSLTYLIGGMFASHPASLGLCQRLVAAAIGIDILWNFQGTRYLSTKILKGLNAGTGVAACAGIRIGAGISLQGCSNFGQSAQE
jgi:hypothetical protein